MMKRLPIVGLVSAVVFMSCGLSGHAAHAAQTGSSPNDAKGLWLSADKGAVIEFKDCTDPAGALCATIVWDKDAGTPLDTCGLMIAKLKKYDDEAWRDGWVHDPRTKKNYKATVRVNKDTLALRAYIGAEILGETEEMSRVATLPAGCKAH
ncbi:MAG: DUF2147 domain-containing protein [Aquabacterium sp.]|nr:DUF2147 domain-containing protein [Aquabacterium sp.]